jgi:hypothetical protein
MVGRTGKIYEMTVPAKRLLPIDYYADSKGDKHRVPSLECKEGL